MSENPKNTTWRDRLVQAIAGQGTSQRAVSLAAGFGPGLVNSWIKDNKDPTIGNLLSVCGVLGISSSWLLYGYEVTPETEEILRHLEANPEARDGILKILMSKASA